MTKQYWVGEFYVDLSRNQITQNQQPQVVAPKALSVLTYLAQKQGEVVSQEVLLSKVWPETVVSPNSLQRCIAQLRKALGDDGKEQIYIKTHSKQGYSLECQVKWLSDSEQVPVQVDTDSSKHHVAPANHEHASPNAVVYLNKKRLLLFILVILCSFVGAHFARQDEPQLFSVGEIRALTASDGKEFASIYSPDGNYIMFHRFSEEECVNNIWAKNLTTKQEHKLTEHIDSYGSHSFSPDGKELVFIRTMNCEKPITQKKCYQLMSMEFAKALKAPQPMNILLECKNSEIRSPHWLNNNNIALLQRESTQWQLISYSPDKNESRIIHNVTDGNIIYYDYSPKDDLFAVISIHADSQHYIETLTSSGELLSSNPIIFTPEARRHINVYANFSPIKDHLIFSTGRQFFTLSFDGTVRNVSMPLDQPAFSPSFHPDGSKALVIKGTFDFDIAAIPFTELSKAHNKLDDYIVARSTMSDNTGILQPGGSLLALSSDRSGEDQVWLYDGHTTIQLSNFPIDSDISAMKWSHDGTDLLVSVNNQLIQLQLDGKQTQHHTQHPIIELLHWDKTGHIALAFANVRGTKKLMEYDLKTNEAQLLTDKRVNWADKSEQGQLIYTDHMDRFWLSGAIEAEQITALNGYGADEQQFIIKENTIFGTNNKRELWSYNLINGALKILGKLPSNFSNISDIDNEKIVIRARISAKKEVVELVMK
ncbi:winged helix-turn-helix domain-containing protein [Pseudoalteromonas luteoviolacea]|uniref:winged helix-turn-helix domain-containing protein n=1 Tax=Pseudoalteromonas luteoviolacea TaxID=43657 RepID=UPI001B3A4445|nr:winged helix-turn-helix domain-containing protein [Pseudoalteromonas luteoviolacea]MBQ4876344.1 winged helix-turn-helix domain-containing protein [Pseudoalteromonas luteoviolacea]MBQ4904974.1 winged helix-turn-helix domain-containing protein [Pseudoalteromonas luteoviolacea]